MKIAIIGAMQSEIDYLLGECDESKCNKVLKNGYTIYNFELLKHEILLVCSGMGRVNSAILFTTLMDAFPDIDLFINVGVAGGIDVNKDKTLHIGDIVIGEKMVYGDVDVRGGEDYNGKYTYGQMTGCPSFFKSCEKIVQRIKEHTNYRFGTICTRDMFTNDFCEAKSLIDKHFSDLNVIAFDMESASFAQCAYLFKKDILIIRALSDIVSDSHEDQREEFLDNFEEASAKSNLALIEVLKLI